MGIAYRTDFDLQNIQRESGKNMEYIVKGSSERFVPHVIEPSIGVERLFLAVLLLQNCLFFCYRFRSLSTESFCIIIFRKNIVKLSPYLWKKSLIK